MLITFPFYEGLSGILTLLNRTFKDKYFDYIKAYPSSTNPVEGRIGAQDVISRNYETSSKHWSSQNIANSNIIFYFPYQYIKLTGYTLKSRSDGLIPYPKAWILYGSNENITNSYEEIHKTSPTNDINGKQKTYPVTCDSYYRFFKIMQTQASNDLYFALAKIEFFGYLQGINRIPCTKSLSLTYPLLSFYMIIILIT